jgi:hypothetical protein
VGRERDLGLIALHGDTYFDGPELGRIDLEFGTVQIIADHPGHVIGHVLCESRCAYIGGDFQSRCGSRIGSRAWRRSQLRGAGSAVAQIA